MLKGLLNRPITVTMGLLVIIVLGIVSINKLPVSLIPDIDVPIITVQVTASNLSSREIDEVVLRPLRQSLIQINSLEEIKTEAKDGSGVISLSFTQGANMDYLFIEVNEKIDRSMGSLRDIERPKVLKSSASDIPAFYVNLTLKDASDNFSRLSLFASEVISRRIEQLPQVAMVDISGFVEPEILVIPDESKLRQMGLNHSHLESAINSANIRLGSLTIRDGEYRYSVKFQSFASNKEDIENISINNNGRVFKLSDLASVIEHPQKRTGLVRASGKEAITMAVIKQSDAKMADLKREMDGLMSQFSKEYPEISFETTRDQTELLDYSINNLVQNIIVGVLLACLIIFLFMKDFRSPALVALTIPTALIFSMLIFFLVGLTINIISLSGLILGVGMMVDNTIILTDNITARLQRGESLREAVINGTKEVVGPMLSSVLTTCAVFIPMIFVSGIAGAMFYDQAIAVTIVLMTAYLVTIIVIPVYYYWWYKNKPFKPNRILAKFSFDRSENVYEKGIKWFFRHRPVGWLLFALSAVGIVLGFLYIPKSKLPEITYTDTLLRVEWNSQLALEKNEDRVKEIERVIGEDALQVTSMVGMQQFLLSHNAESSLSSATIYLKCTDAKSLDRVKKRVGELMQSRWGGALYLFENSGNIFDMVFSDKEADLVARLRPTSDSWIEARSVVSITDQISRALPDMDLASPSLKRDILYVADPEKMALYGADYNSLLTALKNALNENQLFTIIQGNKSIPVVMGTDLPSLSEVIQESFIRVGDSEIPISFLMKQTWEEDLKSIISGAEGNYYPLALNLNGKNAKDVISKVREVVSKDESFDVNFSGSYFSNLKMVNEMIIVLLISLILLYLILASQFESLVQPVIILSEIIIDIFFSLVVLWICGVTINLMSLIGLVVVCGIVINDSILKIDTINTLRKGGFGVKRAIMVAGNRRLKAIVMTSLTTILSVCPFLVRGSMGDDLQYPMSLVIIAGMTVGTLVSLFFVPILYYAIYKGKK